MKRGALACCAPTTEWRGAFMRLMSVLARWVVLLLCSGACVTAAAKVLILDHARAELTINGQVVQRDVALPYGWDFHHKGAYGKARFRLEFDAPIEEVNVWAMSFSRLGNAFEVRLNGGDLAGGGSLDEPNSSDYAKVPRMVRIPSNQLQAHNFLEVDVRCDPGRRCGMPEVKVGDVAEIEGPYAMGLMWRLGSSLMAVMLSLMVGLFACVLWFVQVAPDAKGRERRDRVYLFAAVAELSWAFFVSDFFVERPPVPWVWWAVAMNTALSLWLWSLLMLGQSISRSMRQRPARWVPWAQTFLVVLAPFSVYFSITLQMPWLWVWWQGVFAVLFLVSVVPFIWRAARSGNFVQRLVAFAYLVNVPVGLHDFYVIRLGDAFSSEAYLRYTAALFGLAVATIAIKRFRDTHLMARELFRTLNARVAQKEQELSASYEQMEQVAREQERTLERSRILRDMHDGVGSHISSAIRQLQMGQSNPDEVLLTLRDSLDQLKLSIDAMNLAPGDVTTLLANMRYRLEPRFKAMGLELQWAMVMLPDLPHLDASAMRQLQYIFFEAFSNVMQHAHAKTLRIEATPELQRNADDLAAVRIRVCDDGCGFDADQVRRKGLASMHERARAIGAKLHISSAPGQTVVELRLPCLRG